MIYNLFVVKERISREADSGFHQKDQLFDMVVKVDEVQPSRGNAAFFEKEFNLKSEEFMLIKMTDTSNVLLYLVCTEQRVPTDLKIGDVIRVNKVAKSKGLMASK